MEANHLQDSKSSSEETDKSEQSVDNTHAAGSSSRTYECVFCKRGFSTAQALGGHMNIHRKDRAKSRLSSVPILLSGSKVVDDDENYPSLKSFSYPPIQTYQPHFSTAPQLHLSYQSFFPVSGWGFRPPHTAELFVDNSQHPNRSLGLRIDQSRVDDHGNKKIDHGSIEEDDLDLELRLGHDP